MSFKEFFVERKTATAITLLLLIIVSVFYFSTGAYNKMSVDPELFKDIKIKAAYSPEGSVKIFANARNNPLAMMKTEEGNSVPEKDSVVIGFLEAGMMKEEKLFSKPGDEIKGLFGIDTRVEGVLSKTGTMVDDFHFLSAEQFEKLEGEERAWVDFNKEEPKLFYTLAIGESPKFKLELEEGSFDDYKEKDINGKSYIPVILGYGEAKMMREEKLFSKTGDTLDGFFGKDIVIAGVLKETKSGLDMMHLVPWTKA